MVVTGKGNDNDVLANIIKFTELTASKAIQKAGVKAVSNYQQRQKLIKQAEAFDNENKKAGKILIVDSVKNQFLSAFNGFNIANIDNGKTLKTCFGHKYYSKAGSCDLAVLWCLYPNITTKQLIDMLTNHFGLHTKKSTVQALKQKVTDHNKTNSNGVNYYGKNMFTDRLRSGNIIMSTEQRLALASLSNAMAEAILPRLSVQAKAEAEAEAKAEAKAKAEAEAKAEAKKAIQPASQPASK